MKSIKLLLAGSLVMITVLAAIPAGKAKAVRPDLDTQTMLCNVVTDGPTSYYGMSNNCDLKIKKYVSVNGGAMQDADSVDAAPIANVGDEVLWTIMVDSNSGEDPENEGGPLSPGGEVKITDVLPSEVTLVSSGVNGGLFADGVWHIDLETRDSFMMTLVTTVNTSGVIQNTARLSELTHDFDPATLDTNPANFVPYDDWDNANNSDLAIIRQASAPRVLGESTTAPQVLGATLADTGNQIISPAILLGVFVTSTLGFVAMLRREQRA